MAEEKSGGQEHPAEKEEVPWPLQDMTVLLMAYCVSGRTCLLNHTSEMPFPIAEVTLRTSEFSSWPEQAITDVTFTNHWLLSGLICF